MKSASAAATSDFSRLTKFWPALLILLIFGFFMFVPLLGRYSVITADEGQRVYPPLEMLRTGDWTVPRLNGEDYLKKPPLLYWQIAVLYKIFGPSEWAARIIPAVSGILFGVVVWLWTRRFARPGVALLAGIIAIGNYFVLQKARESQLDMPLGLMTVLCHWGLWEVFIRMHRGRAGTWPWFVMATVALAAGLMYKGPVPWLFVACAWIGAAVATRRYTWILHWKFLLCLALSAVPLVLWGFAVVDEMGYERALQVWNREAERHLVTASEINSGSPVFYIGRLTLLLPWAVALFCFFRKRFYRDLITAEDADPRREFGVDRATAGFLMGGAFLSFVVMSLIPAKETEYLLGLVGPMCIMLALAWQWLYLSRRWRPTTIRWAVGVSAALWLIITYGPYMYIKGKETRANQVLDLAAFTNKVLARGVPVASYGIESTRPNFYFYVDEVVPNLYKPHEVEKFFEDHPDGMICMRTKRMERLQKDYGDKFEVKASAADHARLVLVGLKDQEPPPGA